MFCYTIDIAQKRVIVYTKYLFQAVSFFRREDIMPVEYCIHSPLLLRIHIIVRYCSTRGAP